MTGRVGVIVVNFNSGDWLRQCLESLVEQTRPAERVVVVDNASSDDSIERASAAAQALGADVVLEKTNLGFAAANNLGARRLGDIHWIALLNPDAIADARWLEKLMGAANEHTSFQFFGARMNQADRPELLDGTGDVYHASGLVWRDGHGRAGQPKDATEREIFSPCAAAALYRRQDFLDAGGFDERYFCYSEDVDLGFRLRLAGHRCLYVPDAIVAHAGSGITGARSGFTIYHGHRNLVWTYIKNMPGYLLWLYLPQHLLMNLVSVVVLSLRGTARDVLRAKRDALSGIGWAWRERQRIQSARQASVADIRSVLSRNPIKAYVSRHD